MTTDERRAARNARDAGAGLMVVGDAPGVDEDRLGLPIAGRAGRLLDELLAGIGIAREDVYVTNIVQSPLPGNRDPAPAEIERCRAHVYREVELVAPVVVCSLGGLATKLLRGDPAPITRLHGRAEIREIGPRTVRLYPVFHPAAALYTPEAVAVLRADVARIPALLALGAPPQPPAPQAEAGPAPDAGAVQLGLF